MFCGLSGRLGSTGSFGPVLCTPEGSSVICDGVESSVMGDEDERCAEPQADLEMGKE